MSVYKKLINLHDYKDSVGSDVIIVNDYDFWNTEHNQMIRDNLSTVYDSKTTLSIAPSCRCGRLSANYLKGKHCIECGTKVEGAFESYLPRVWFKAIDYTGMFLNPDVYATILRKLKIKTNILRWIGDTGYNPNYPKDVFILDHIRSMDGFERTHSWCMSNIFNILESIRHIFPKIKGKYESIGKILEMMEKNMSALFSEYIPIPSDKLTIFESTNMGNYVSSGLLDISDVTMLFMKNKDSEHQYIRERTMSQVNAVVAGIYESNLTDVLGQKLGILRKHLMSKRLAFSARYVIVPKIGPHEYDEMSIPWVMANVLFRPHLINYMIKELKLKFKDVNRRLSRAIETYDPLIHELLNRLITESRDGCIWMNAHRNPVLKQGSMLRLRVTEIKADPNDKTVSISILICKLPNADFDGDEMNFFPYLDNDTSDAFATMDPFYSSMDVSNYGGVSGLLTLTNPVINTVSNAIRRERADL